MDAHTGPTSAEEQREFRTRCYECFRPAPLCFCDAVPSIRNQTKILILQHVKERFHAFNTARIVQKSLQNATLIVDQTPKLASMKLPIDDNTGLLFPGKESRLLSEVPPSELPKQLVILDGTWHHAKTFMKQIPSLSTLPQFRLSPSAPSRYRLRREPTTFALSTLEATVSALKTIEPNTDGFEALIGAFDRMVETQLRHPRDAVRRRKPRHPWKAPTNIPAELIESPENVVVVYGEASRGGRKRRRQPEVPVSWLAERLIGGDTFECILDSDQPHTNEFLSFLGLTPGDFNGAASLQQFADRWNSFLKPDDLVVAYNESTLRLLQRAGLPPSRSTSLKSVNLKTNGTTLDEILDELNIDVRPQKLRGRGGQRLANVIAYTGYLAELGMRQR